MLVKFLNNKKAQVAIMSISMVVMMVGVCFADSQGAANEMFDVIWTVVCAVPALMAIMAGINAAIAYSQAHQDGGNAAAAGKFSSLVVSCLVCIVITILCATKLKSIVQGLFG